MAFVSEDSLSFRLGGSGYLTGTWAYANFNLSTDGGKVNWSVTMETPEIGSSKIPAINFYFYIDGQKVFNEYYKNYGLGFPCYPDSASSGSVTLKDPNATSISVEVKLAIAGSSPYQYTASKNLSRIYYTPASQGTVSVRDNKDSTFTIYGLSKGSGTNNPTTGPYVAYGINRKVYSTDIYGGSSSTEPATKPSDPIPLPASAPAKSKVYVRCVTKATYGSDSIKDIEAEVINYLAPGKPGVPKLSYNKSRLTIKEPWTFTWDAAEKTSNSYTGVAGYYIMLLRKAKGASSFSYVCKPIDNGNNYLGIDKEAQTDTNYYLRRDGTSCKVIIKNPADFGFEPGDEVKLRVKAFSLNGLSNTLQSDYVDSEAETVQNAGIVHTKVPNVGWKEGQVYVKVSGAWKEAETVQTKTGGSWKESQ